MKHIKIRTKVKAKRELTPAEKALANLPFVVEKSEYCDNLYRIWMKEDAGLTIQDFIQWTCLCGDFPSSFGSNEFFEGKTDWNGRLIVLRIGRKEKIDFIIDYPNDEYLPF